MHFTKKISQAKAKLLVEYPYFGTLASRLELVVDENIEAFKSDGKKLHYNSDFLENSSISEIEFILANGAMHSSLAHENRKNGRSGWLWQMATDMAINDMLFENGLDKPYQAQYRERFKGMYAEEIYAELQDDILRDELEYEADDVEDIAQKDTQIEAEEILQEQLQSEESLSLLEKEFEKGTAPLEIERFFKLNFLSKIDWRDELKIALDRYFQDDYTLFPPNKKFLSQGIYLPSTISQTFRLVIAIDSSGSIDENLLNQFLSEVNFLMSVVHNYQIELLVSDETLRSHKTFYSGESLEVEIEGGMGTDFRAVFEFIEENFDDIKLLLYFTDLEGSFPQNIPCYSVKWVTSKERDVPFGDVILL